MSLAEQRITTASLLKGTILENDRKSDSTRSSFFHNLANCAEVERQREAVAVVKAMAELVDVPTQSVMEADGDDDMTSAGHVTKSCGRRWVTARKPNEN